VGASRPTSGAAGEERHPRPHRIYEVQGAEREDRGPRGAAGVRPWWRAVRRDLDNEFPGLRDDAAPIQVYCRSCVPGLLQTRHTWRRSSSLRAADRLARKGGRAARRHEILDRADGPSVARSKCRSQSTARAVRRDNGGPRATRWGMHSDRREQIDHLAEMTSGATSTCEFQRFG